MNMIKIEFFGESEVRMGSPFTIASVELVGVDWRPKEFLNRAFVGNVSDVKNELVGLALWQHMEPDAFLGFRAAILDTKNRTIVVSQAYREKPLKLTILGPNKVAVEVHRYSSGGVHPPESLELDVNEAP